MAEDPAHERERLLQAGDEAWAELCAALDAAPADRALHDPESPAWTSRDVYTHFIRMHVGSARAVRRMLGDQSPGWSGEDEDALNERWRAEDSSISLDDARVRANETRRVYRDLLMSLTPEQWSAAGKPNSDDIDGGHYRGHLSYIVER